jgi:hypothetical protein
MQGQGWAESARRGILVRSRKRKKEEFPGIMENMPLGNSFPQICVVSINECATNGL